MKWVEKKHLVATTNNTSQQIVPTRQSQLADDNRTQPPPWRTHANTWSPSTIILPPRQRTTTHQFAPTENVAHILLFAQQPMFKPYFHHFQGVPPQAPQSQGQNTNTTLEHGENLRTLGQRDFNSLSKQFTYTSTMQPPYVPQMKW